MVALVDVEKSSQGDGRKLPRRRRRRRNAKRLGAASLIVSIVVFSFAFPLTPWYDPFSQDLGNALAAPMESAAHILGTDALGRDLLSRLALAGRYTLLVTLAIITSNLVVGGALGLVAGYFGGPLGRTIMTVANIQLALPVILILVALAAALGPSLVMMVVVIAACTWIGQARVARAATLSLRQRDFLLAPVTQGASTFWILRRHVLPHLTPQMLILAVSDVGFVMLLVAGADYLGLGVQPPATSWGLMIAEGQEFMVVSPWPVILPGIAIFMCVAGTLFYSQRFTGESESIEMWR